MSLDLVTGRVDGTHPALPVKVSKTDLVKRSYMTLFDRESSPEVLSTGVSTAGASSVK